MHVQERLAWWGVGFSLGPLLLVVLLLLAGAGEASCAVFALLAANAFTGLRSGRGKEGRVVLDERDEWIAQQAVRISFGFFWLCWVLLIMTPLFVKGPNASITLSTTFLCDLGFGSMAVVLAVRYLSTIYYYRKGRDAAENR